MRILRLALVTVAGWAVALSATAATFSFEFAYDGVGIPEIPTSVELVSNSFVTTNVQVNTPTTLEIYRLEQSDPAGLASYLGAPNDNIDLVLGSGRFDLTPQAFDFAGQLVGTTPFSGSFFNSLGLVFNDPGFGDVPNYYALIPFRFFVDSTADYSGIMFGSMTGTSNVIYVQLPQEGGLYRIQAAGVVPEPAVWAMMLIGFVAVGATVRRRGRVQALVGAA